MNQVLILTHNNLELTKRMVQSVLSQDLPCEPFFVDNGSTDGTVDWIKSHTCRFILFSHNEGVSAGWNAGLERLFNRENHPWVIVGNNDTVLAPWTVRELLSYEVPFVTGVSVESMDMIDFPAGQMPLSPSPDFSLFLMRRSVWDKVGHFDERMKHYASDNSFHVEAHRKGVQLLKSNCRFYHERSSTLRLASPEERAEIEAQANRDRAVFESKYGCQPWGPGYDQLFKT